MPNVPAITWILTTVLILSGSYHFLLVIKSKETTEKINRGFHTLMSGLMTAMLWNIAPSTMLAQIAVLACAAFWFVIQAVARPEFKKLCTGGHGRLRCCYHSLSMVGGALMIAMMISHGAYSNPGADPGDMNSMPFAHHARSVPSASPAAATSDHSLDLAVPLAVLFSIAALIFIIQMVNLAGPKNKFVDGAARKFSARVEAGVEALCAMAMASMFATMA